MQCYGLLVVSIAWLLWRYWLSGSCNWSMLLWLQQMNKQITREVIFIIFVSDIHTACNGQEADCIWLHVWDCVCECSGTRVKAYLATDLNLTLLMSFSTSDMCGLGVGVASDWGSLWDCETVRGYEMNKTINWQWYISIVGTVSPLWIGRGSTLTQSHRPVHLTKDESALPFLAKYIGWPTTTYFLPDHTYSQ